MPDRQQSNGRCLNQFLTTLVFPASYTASAAQSAYLPWLWRADVWAARWVGESTGSPLPSNWLSHTASQSWQIGFLGIHEHWGQGRGCYGRVKALTAGISVCLTSYQNSLFSSHLSASTCLFFSWNPSLIYYLEISYFGCLSVFFFFFLWLG